MDNSQKYKQLGKDTFIYGIGGSIAKGFSVLLIPIYTRLFTPEQYGIIELLVIISNLFGALLVFGLDSASTFYFFERKKDGIEAQGEVITSVLVWRVLFGALLLIAGILFSPMLNIFFFDGNLTVSYFVVLFMGMFFIKVMLQSADVFRLLYQPIKYITIFIGHSVLAGGITIVLVTLLNTGVIGFFWGLLFSAFVWSLVGWWSIRKYIVLRKSIFKLWKKLLRFGAPLIASAIGIYILNSSDRWFITHYLDLNTLGIYAIGAKFSFLISLIVKTFRQAWLPVSMNTLTNEENPEFYKAIADFFFSFGVILIILLTLFSKLILVLLTSSEYHSAYPYVGILSWSALFYGFHLILVTGIWKAKKTEWTSIGMFIAVIINLILDYILIPVWGALGAAIATSFAYLIWNMITMYVSERFWRVGYAKGKLLLFVSIGAAACSSIILIYSAEKSFFYAAIIALTSITFIYFYSGLNVNMKSIIVYAKNYRNEKNKRNIT